MDDAIFENPAFSKTDRGGTTRKQDPKNQIDSKGVKVMTTKVRAFTLIELLIVVAIIAILAAIAVPNFLEAQTRSKVSRCAADMRSMRTALEAYAVDNNHYPETDVGPQAINGGDVSMSILRLTTPTAYITSIPKSPFKEESMGNPGSPKYSNYLKTYLYVRAEVTRRADGSVYGLTPDSSPLDGFDDNYEQDRIRYIAQNVSLIVNAQERIKGAWELKSVGPNNVDDFNVIGANARRYDPTNGTISAGDVVVFSDITDTK
jgi:type II secretion system protein G